MSTVQPQKKSGKIRPLICYAVVKKGARKFSAKEIYADDDVWVLPYERLVKVTINEI